MHTPVTAGRGANRPLRLCTGPGGMEQQVPMEQAGDPRLSPRAAVGIADPAPTSAVWFVQRVGRRRDRACHARLEFPCHGKRAPACMVQAKSLKKEKTLAFFCSPASCSSRSPPDLGKKASTASSGRTKAAPRLIFNTTISN